MKTPEASKENTTKTNCIYHPAFGQQQDFQHKTITFSPIDFKLIHFPSNRQNALKKYPKIRRAKPIIKVKELPTDQCLALDKLNAAQSLSLVELQGLGADLGKNSTLNQRKLKYEFKKLAKKYHPDLSSNPNDTDKFILLKKSYTTLNQAFSELLTKDSAKPA